MKVKLIDIHKNDTIVIDYNVIKKKNYFSRYKKFHSSEKVEKGYLNYKSYINNMSKYNSDILLYNVELLQFDDIIMTGLLDTHLLLNHNYKIFNSHITYKLRVYIQYSLSVEFSYNYYTQIRPFIFENSSHILDIALNKYFIQNNILFGFNLGKLKIKNTTLELKNSEYYKADLINSNIEYYNDICIFEKVLRKKDIHYEIYIECVNTNFRCPITYECSNDIKIKSACNHTFSFSGFINHLQYSNSCPICQECLFNKTIKLIGSTKNIKKLMYGNTVFTIIKNEYFNLFIIGDSNSCNILNKRIYKLDEILTHKWDIRFVNLLDIYNGIDNICINSKICLHISDTVTQLERYKVLKSISNNKNMKNIIMNTIKYK